MEGEEIGVESAVAGSHVPVVVDVVLDEERGHEKAVEAVHYGY